ncbi:uncharacterized protein LOC133818724 [Humulus lupulus]|uniref:uncharacterized protein LOC133818724 n=1 Tax=Humulus lupulus TaxID=3486 RepID=UPI002B402CFD|nr:uncharacterized protein LOC133818724 [Humulus lupulus]
MGSTARGRRDFESLTPTLTLKRRTSTPSTAKNPKTQTPFSSPIASIVSIKAYSVFLEDWWLIKVNGKDLGVGGFASRGGLGVRVFSSAAVSKRHSATVFETTDGFTIKISGLINMARTHHNGFPSEICNPFLLGFPHNWEEYAARCLGKECTNQGVSLRTSASVESNINSVTCTNNSSLPPFTDLPVPTIRDLLLSTFGHSDYDLLIKNIYKETLTTSKNEPCENSGAPMDLNMENVKNLASNGKYVPNATAIKKQKGKTGRNNVSVPRQYITRSMSRKQARERRSRVNILCEKI